MMSPPKAEQGAARGTAERPQHQAEAASGERSQRQESAETHGGYDPRGGYDRAFAGGYGTPPYGMPPYGMPPFGMPPYGMPPYGMPFPGMPPFGPAAPGMGPFGMPPGMHPGAAQQQASDPARMGFFSAFAPMSWFAPWLMPWVATFWSWFASWFAWPGFAWLMPPFGPFAPMPGAPAPDPQAMRFADARAYFWHHCFQAMAAVAHQAANACYADGAIPAGARSLVDMTQLKEALKSMPAPQADMVMHAVHMLQAMEAFRPKPPAGPDW